MMPEETKVPPLATNSRQRQPAGVRWPYNWPARSLTTLAALLIVCVVALATLSACGAPSVDKTLTLGTLLPTSGPESAVGLAMQQAVDLAIKQNTKLPNGYTLRVTHQDEQSVAGDDAMSAFGNNAELVGVVGPLDSATALAMLPGVEQTGITTITPAATLPGLTQATAATSEGLTFNQLHPTGKPVAFFRLPATDSALGKAAADTALAPGASHGLGAHSVFVVDDGGASGKAQAAAFTAELKAKGGALAGHASLTPGDPVSAQSTVSAIIDALPDAVFFGGDAAGGAQLRSTLSLTGAPQLPLLLVGPSADDPGWGAAVGATAAAAYTTAILPAPTLAALPSASAVAAFSAAYQAAYHATPLPLCALAYDAAMDEIAAIRSALAAGKAPTREAVRAAVAASKYNGLIGPISFDQNGDSVAPPGFSVYTCDTKGVWTFQTSLNA